MKRLTVVVALTLTLGFFITGCDSGLTGTETQPESTPKASQQGPVASSHGSGTRIATVLFRPPEPGDSDIRGRLRITDDGETVRVTGRARGLDPNKNYISLFYGVGSTVTGPLACEALVVPHHPGDPANALPPDQMHVGGWKTPGGDLPISAPRSPFSLGFLRALDWPTLFEGFGPGQGYSGEYNLKNTPVEMKDDTPGNAVPDYVPIERVGTISIRDLSVTGPLGRAGFGPDAVKACGKVIPAGATLLVARLEELGGSGVIGEATVVKKGDQLRVFVHARGVAPDVEHAQHVHENPSCAPPGTPIVALDDDIANSPRDATNADPGDDSFPTASSNGEVNYRESDSKRAVESALGEDLDLENRTVVVHAAGNPIGGPVACGELNPFGGPFGGRGSPVGLGK